MRDDDFHHPGADLAAAQFRAFVALLIRARATVMQMSEADGRAGAEALSAELCQLIEQQHLEAGRLGARDGAGGVDSALHARFIKAALADEVLLSTEWAGRVYWRHVLVESRLLNSAHAGQRVFADIDGLLRERDPARRALARLYLNLLALGFEGRYRGSADLAPLAAYRRDLFEFAYQRAPDARARDAVLIEQPYAATLSYGTHQRVPVASRRGAALLLTLLVMLLSSEALWVWQSWPVRQLLAPTQQVAP
jgi:type VI secretion system protein ImpK